MSAPHRSSAETAVLGCAIPLHGMKFTLTYDGDLPGSGNNPKPRDKWHIRRQLHPQLAELWQTNSVLKRLAQTAWVPKGGYMQFEQHHSAPVKPASPREGDWNLCEPIEVGRHKFIPLVRESMALICGLDVLFLRKEEPGALIKQGGDIDNRIKTLFDGLKVPSQDDMRFCGEEA